VEILKTEEDQGSMWTAIGLGESILKHNLIMFNGVDFYFIWNQCKVNDERENS